VHFYIKCAAVFLICTVITAHLSGELAVLFQSSWLNFGDGRRRRKGTGRKVGRGKEVKRRGGNGTGKRGSVRIAVILVGLILAHSISQRVEY